MKNTDPFSYINLSTIGRCNALTDQHRDNAVFFLPTFGGEWLTAEEAIAKYPQYTRKIRY